MPIYVYLCAECGEELEKIGKATDPAPPCPGPDGKGCKGSMKRKPTSTTFQLKGDGWFKDGY